MTKHTISSRQSALVLCGLMMLGQACGIRVQDPPGFSAQPQGPEESGVTVVPCTPVTDYPTAPAADPHASPTGSDPSAPAAPTPAGTAAGQAPAAASGGPRPAGTPAAPPPPPRAADQAPASAAGATQATQRPAEEQAQGSAPDAPAVLPGSISIDGPDSQGVTDSEIRIGISAPLSGAAGFLGKYEVGAISAYLNSVNAKGGVKGRKYKIIAMDDQYNASQQATAVRRLVEQYKVFFYNVLFAENVGDYITNVGIPTTVFGVTPPSFRSGWPNVYPVGFPTFTAMATLAETLVKEKQLPIKKVAILYDNVDVPIHRYLGYMKKVWESLGVEVVSTDAFSLSQGNCSSLVIKMRNLDIDYWDHAYTLGWPICEVEMARQNWRPRYGRGGPYTADITFTSQAGEAAEGVYGAMNGVRYTGDPASDGGPYPGAEKAPAFEEYVDSIKRFQPNIADIAGIGSVWTQVFWTAGKLIHDAIEHQAKAITWRGVNEWIQKQKGWASGLLAPVESFAPDCKTGTPSWVFQWEWTDQGLQMGDWRPLAGYRPPSQAIQDAVAGGGKCFNTRMADAIEQK